MEEAGPIREVVAVATAITRLVQEHHAEVYRYAYRLTGSATDAEDIAQETFLLAFRRLDQLREAEKAGGWLMAIVRNFFLKQKQRKTLPTETLTEDSLPASSDELPDWIDQERLQQALLRLPDDTRLILLLFFFEDCSYNEIAEKLAIPIGTVMSRLSRAKNRLRQELIELNTAAMQ